MEEAQFLKDDAEAKFEEQDFGGALRLANEAENLYPDLQGIQQYIAAYSVHVAAYESNITTITARRTYGDNVTSTKVKVPDWYKVLDIEDDLVDSDDLDAIIKKQYKRMALLVHPDKNDSVAAESAFKLVQEALEILSDPDKRKQFEMKRRNRFGPEEPPSPASTCDCDSSDSDEREQSEIIIINRLNPEPALPAPKCPNPRNSKSWRQKPRRQRSRFKVKRESRQEFKYKVGHPSFWEVDDTWYSEEEEEAGEEYEEMKTEVRLCPTCGYPRDAKINEKVCFSVLHCEYCDRVFRFF